MIADPSKCAGTGFPMLATNSTWSCRSLSNPCSLLSLQYFEEMKRREKARGIFDPVHHETRFQTRHNFSLCMVGCINLYNTKPCIHRQGKPLALKSCHYSEGNQNEAIVCGALIHLHTDNFFLSTRIVLLTLQ